MTPPSRCSAPTRAGRCTKSSASSRSAGASRSAATSMLTRRLTTARSARDAPGRPSRPRQPDRPGTAASPSPAESPRDVRVATEADLSAILTLDRAAYGADRTRILTRLPGFAERVVVLEATEGIVGYAAAWRTEAYLVIGPLVAPAAAAARRPVTELATASTVAVRLDLDPDRPELPSWARAHGLEPTERTVF